MSISVQVLSLQEALLFICGMTECDTGRCPIDDLDMDLVRLIGQANGPFARRLEPVKPVVFFVFYKKS